MSSFQPRSGATIYSADSQALVLGGELGRGGEGSVWSIEGNPSVVAKFYHKGLAPEQARKVETMCRLRSEALLRISAWPLTTLRARSSGPSHGFLMPRIKGYQEAHLLYTPKSRRTCFPEAQFPFILHASINIARAFATVHDAGQVIGDVNHGNLLVGNEATVALIDCDSFQISDAGVVFPCLVGVPTYTPPELQGISFQSVRRTHHHDEFGLAILLFQMLFLGRHPFAGIFRHGAADKTIEEAIREFRFAYLSDSRLTEMEPPPAVPRLSELPPDIARLFVRAFSEDGATGRRPAAEEWLDPLESLSRSLKRCPANETHHYFNALSSCPWCRVENKFGLSMFGIKFAQVSNGAAFDLVLVWAQIEGVRPENRTLSAPRSTSYLDQCQPDRRVAEARAQRRIKRILSAGAILFAVILIISGLIPAFPSICILTWALIVMTKLWRAGDREASWVTGSRQEAADAYNAGIREWIRLEEAPAAFEETKCRLQSEKQELTNLPSLRARKMAELNSARRDKQLARFLERHRIEDSVIPNIGPGRKTLLRCYNIEDASDVVPSRLEIKGFGPVLRTSLLMWRYSIEQKFVFNPNEGIDPVDIRALDGEMAQKRAALLASLSSGPVQLRAILSQWRAERSRLLGDLERSAKALAQAETNVKALGRF